MTMTTELNSFPKYSKISSNPSYYTAQPNLTNLSTSKLNRAARQSGNGLGSVKWREMQRRFQWLTVPHKNVTGA